MRSPPVSPRIGIGPTSEKMPRKPRLFGPRASARSFFRCFDPYRFGHRLRQDRPERADHSDRAWEFLGIPTARCSAFSWWACSRNGAAAKRGNLLAMICGFLVVAVLSGLHNDLWILLHPSAPGVVHPPLWSPAWLPRIEFPWRIAFGAVVTFASGRLFQDTRIAGFRRRGIRPPSKPHGFLTCRLVKHFTRQTRNFLLDRSALFS